MIELEYEMTYEETIAGLRSSKSVRSATRGCASLFLGRGRLVGPRAISYDIYRVL